MNTSSMKMCMNDGDFFQTCLPKTYDQYEKFYVEKSCIDPSYDEFDYFIMKRVPILSYIIEEYYMISKHPKLQLCCLCLDQDVLRQWTWPSSAMYEIDAI